MHKKIAAFNGGVGRVRSETGGVVLGPELCRDAAI